MFRDPVGRFLPGSPVAPTHCQLSYESLPEFMDFQFFGLGPMLVANSVVPF